MSFYTLHPARISSSAWMNNKNKAEKQLFLSLAKHRPLGNMAQTLVATQRDQGPQICKGSTCCSGK